MQKIGDEIKSCCPFHKEVTPSFFVNLKLGIYHCFGCGVKGRIDFQEDKNKKDYNNCSLSLQNTVKKELYLPKEFKTCFWGGHLVYVPEYFKKRFINLLLYLTIFLRTRQLFPYPFSVPVFQIN